MKRLASRMMFPLVALSLAFSALPAQGQDAARGKQHHGARLNVTVSFGAGLNTAGAANHHILPPVIRVRQGGVVNFAVAGFHQIFVYNPGTTPTDVTNALPNTTGAFINFMDNLFYQGIAPAGGPAATPPTISPSNGTNRVESVSFTTPGEYLVICNVRTHFVDGMFAIVKVIEAAPK